jgi:hypothetical protein
MPRASSRLKSTKRPRYTEVIPGRASKLIKTANEKLAAKPSVPTVVPVDSSDSEASYPFSRSPSPSEQALAPISMPPDDVEVENVFNKLNELNSDIFALRDDIKDIKTTMNDILKILKGKPAISGNRAVGRKISASTLILLTLLL